MNITLKEITVRELTDGYVDNAEDREFNTFLYN